MDTVHVTSNSLCQEGSTLSGWSRPVGVTLVQIIIDSCVGSPDATPCTNAPCTSPKQTPKPANSKVTSAKMRVEFRGANPAMARDLPERRRSEGDPIQQ